MSATWITKDGSRIRVCDMSDGHLLNAMRMIQRGAHAIKVIKDAEMLALPEPTGEFAGYAFAREQDMAWGATPQSYVPDVYHDLEKEAGGRGLKCPWEDRTQADAVASLALVMPTKVAAARAKAKAVALVNKAFDREVAGRLKRLARDH